MNNSERSKKLYEEIKKNISCDPIYFEKLMKMETSRLKYSNSLSETISANKEVEEWINQMKTGIIDSTMDALPIESLKDISEIEKNGKTSKPKFSDFYMKNTKTYDKIVEITDEHDKVLSEYKIDSIDFLQEKIKKILEAFEEK